MITVEWFVRQGHRCLTWNKGGRASVERQRDCGPMPEAASTREDASGAGAAAEDAQMRERLRQAGTLAATIETIRAEPHEDDCSIFYPGVGTCTCGKDAIVAFLEMPQP